MATEQIVTEQMTTEQMTTEQMTTGQAAADQTASGPVLKRRDAEGVAWLTLNRPAARNALSMGLMAALDAELAALAGNKAVKVVVIGGAGPAFCAGHDLREIRANPAREAYEAVFALCSRLMQRIVHLPQPVIARVHGIATAAGCQLVATCDLAVAADTARFATPGVDIGLFCSTPMVALSRAVHRKAAMEMLLTGEMTDAGRARELGLINRVVPEAELDTAVAALAARIAGKSPLTLAIGKEAFYRQAEMDLATAYDYAAGVMTRNMLARDAAEGIDAFLQKRAPHWSGT
jgi:enoyl-CoA hydratase/carnithine racemase